MHNVQPLQQDLSANPKAKNSTYTKKDAPRNDMDAMIPLSAVTNKQKN